MMIWQICANLYVCMFDCGECDETVMLSFGDGILVDFLA